MDMDQVLAPHGERKEGHHSKVYKRRQNRHVAPWDVEFLSPSKLAAFYRLVGGNFDSLFLETPSPSLSFIYQSLGCFHTLQPEEDPFVAPKLPALTPHGFVKWQTAQVLLDPDEHVALLQNAVKRLEITNPADGIPFPYPLPREALPSRPDPEMVQWHQGIGEGMKLNVAAIRGPSAATSNNLDHDTTEGSIVSADDGRPSMDSVDDIGRVHPPPFRPPPSLQVPEESKALPFRGPQGLPWALERRRSSTSDLRYPIVPSAAYDEAMEARRSNRLALRRPRPRSPSTASTSSISSSDSSSLAASSTSTSPRHKNSHRHHHQSLYYPPQGPTTNRHDRRHSSHDPHLPREMLETHNLSPHRPRDHRALAASSSKPPGTNSRGLNVRWGDVDIQQSKATRLGDVLNQNLVPRNLGARHRDDDHDGRMRRSRAGSGGRTASPMRGVGGRRYVADDMHWR
ncbi:MAG: hypothetical protein Q9183_001145 [Haloplaca sp. 2 TL-2023]